MKSEKKRRKRSAAKTKNFSIESSSITINIRNTSGIPHPIYPFIEYKN